MKQSIKKYLSGSLKNQVTAYNGKKIATPCIRTVRNDRSVFSGSLKARIMPHNDKRIATPCIRTLRNDRSIFSGSLKHLVFTTVLGLSLHFTYADDITNTNNYLPNGKYRLFGSGRGEVHNIDNQIRLHGQLSQQAGNLHIQTSLYQGNLSYQQHFHNHGHRQHAPFENKAQRNFSAKKGSIVQGGATLTDLSVTGYEIHPADAYDGEQGGGYPLPTGARDEYLYEVNGKEVSVKVVALDKLPNKTHDNQLLRKAGIDPERYNQPQTNQRQTNQPQTSNNHTPSQRLSFAKNPHNGYSSDIQHHLGDLSYSDSSWAHTEIPLPRSETTSIRSYGSGGSAYSRVTDSYGNHTALLKPYSTSFANSNAGSGLVVRKETITATSRSVTPNPYGSSQSSAFGGLSWGSSSNSQGSFGGGSGNGGSSGSGGSGNQQNNHNEPPIDDRPDDYPDDRPDNRPDDNDSPTHQQQDYPCWIFADSGCQPSIQLACFASSEADSFSMGGCTKHSEENYNKLIYLGEPIFISAYHDYGDDNQGDDNQKQDNQDDKKQDDKEKRQSYEDFLFALSQLPPPPFTEYIDDDNTQNENKSSENQSDKNNDDWQAEKWDSPVDWNMAEIAIGIGSVANDLLNIANKGRLGDLSPDVLKRNAALGDLNSINNLEAASEITATQANALRKAAAGKADNAAGAADDFNRNRPSNFRKSTVNDAWDNAANGSQPNTKQCPTCGKDVKGNPHNNESRNTSDGWDVSHNPSWSNRPQNYNSRKELLDDYNSGVQLECRNCNRSGGNNDARFGKNGDN